MKVGFFGGMILLGLTIIFSMIAIQNNKLAREITVKSFGLDKAKHKRDTNETNQSKQKQKVIIKVKMQKSNFDKEFEEFDKKFDNF